MDEDVIPRIKFIGKIQKGEKINVKHMNIQQDSIVTKIIRSFIYNDTRSNAYSFINTTIKKGFDTLYYYLNNVDKIYDKTICQNLINDLKNCKNGMMNIKDTYIEDLMFSCKIDSLIEETEARILDIEQKYMGLFKENTE
jgi:hypothetical protein